MKQTSGNEAPQKFGRYTTERLLGKGAMGRVYLAIDPVLERQVALKVISIDPSLAKETRDDYFRRFSFEAKASARLSHQSIVTVFDTGEENGIPWIAFQFVEGETLEHYLHKRGKLPLKRAITFSLDIASALEHAHCVNIIHRDVKPANILIEHKTGIAKLADFGIVKTPWDTMTRQGDTLGSPGYMSPEQIEGSELDTRADIFCFGVVMYQMISGQHPFLRDSLASTAFATCNGKYFPLKDFADNVPPALDYAIRKCLEPDRKHRLSSATELISLLNNLSQSNIAVSGISATRIEAVNPLLLKTKGKFWFQQLRHECVDICKFAYAGFIAALPKIGYAVMHPSETIAAAKQLPKKISRDILRSKLFWACLIGSLIAGISFAILLFVNSPKEPIIGSTDYRYMKQCEIALEESNRGSALDAVVHLTRIPIQFPHVCMLVARVMIRDNKFDVAAHALSRANQLRGGNAILHAERDDILDEIVHLLKRGPASDELIAFAAKETNAGHDRIVRQWLKDTNYWLRWNAVDVCKKARIKVDVVPVYILDLDFAGNVQTRVQSIRKLGELKDNRAVDDLEKVKALGDNDPVASREAARVLAECFK